MPTESTQSCTGFSSGTSRPDSGKRCNRPAPDARSSGPIQSRPCGTPGNSCPGLKSCHGGFRGRLGAFRMSCGTGCNPSCRGDRSFLRPPIRQGDIQGNMNPPSMQHREVQPAPPAPGRLSWRGRSNNPPWLDGVSPGRRPFRPCGRKGSSCRWWTMRHEGPRARPAYRHRRRPLSGMTHIRSASGARSWMRRCPRSDGSQDNMYRVMRTFDGGWKALNRSVYGRLCIRQDRGEGSLPRLQCHPCDRSGNNCPLWMTTRAGRTAPGLRRHRSFPA
jgi:hypothetical protein